MLAFCGMLLWKMSGSLATVKPGSEPAVDYWTFFSISQADFQAMSPT